MVALSRFCLSFQAIITIFWALILCQVLCQVREIKCRRTLSLGLTFSWRKVGIRKVTKIITGSDRCHWNNKKGDAQVNPMLRCAPCSTFNNLCACGQFAESLYASVSLLVQKDDKALFRALKGELNEIVSISCLLSWMNNSNKYAAFNLAKCPGNWPHHLSPTVNKPIISPSSLPKLQWVPAGRSAEQLRTPHWMGGCGQGGREPCRE